MRIAYLECFSGISGDMMLGALLHAGVSQDLLERSINGLHLGAELRVSRVDRSGISATKADVLVNGVLADCRVPDFQAAHHDEGHSHHGNHHHDHDSNDAHDHAISHKHSHQHGYGRSLSTIREILKNARLPELARNTAIRAFELLGEAEAAIHNVPVESIHFHEVGAVDALVDIVGSAVGCHALGVDRFICSPLNVGGGTVKCTHGEYPVPAPATLALLKGAPVYASGVSAELVTPTGAALVRALDCQFCPFPPMNVDAIGYGAGTRNPQGYPNVLRISIGEAIETHRSGVDGASEVVVLETTVDDLNPQVTGYVTEMLLARGALDVFLVPVQMKKNRPGVLLTILCEPASVARLRDVLFRETSTIGVRTRHERRDCLQREVVTVSTRWGSIRVKEARQSGTVTNFAPEYEDCRRIAESESLPLKQVQQEAISAYLSQHRLPAPLQDVIPAPSSPRKKSHIA
jgi:uncharacterized protein (TIGR00299 family) protein